MQTLDFQINANGTGLAQLTVEMDGVVSVIKGVVPRLLVAARLERKKLDPVRSVERGLDAVQLSTDGNEGEDGEGDLSYEDGESGKEGVSEDSKASSTDEDRPARSSTSGASSEDQAQDGRLNRMRILELRAEGMADFLADEYPAKLPHDFY